MTLVASQFRTCIDRLDAVIEGSLAIPQGPLRFFDDGSVWFGRAWRLAYQIMAIFSVRDSQPRELFGRARSMRLDEVVQGQMKDWKYAVNGEFIDNNLIDVIKDEQLEHCTPNFRVFVMVWVYAALTKALGRERVYFNFIKVGLEFQTLQHYMASQKILSRLLSFPETFVFNANGKYGRKTSRRMNADEVKGFIKDFMAYIEFVLHPDEIDELVAELTAREQEQFRDAMAS